MITRTLLPLASLVGLLVSSSLAPALAQKVGTAAAVKPSSSGTPPGGAMRTLEIGTDIVSRERIRTTGAGSLQVMFIDRTTLTIGPNSDLLIDEFVYRPEAGTGSFTATLAKGALRFVGGQVSHTAGATVTTPVATIGIRGGAAFITHTTTTTVVCTGGACSVNSTVGPQSFQLRVNQAVEIGGVAGAQPYNVTSVTLNDAAKGGSGNITSGAGVKSSGGVSGQGGTSTAGTQTPEPRSPFPQ